MNLLALDPATKTGYYTEGESGVWDFKLKPYESTGIKFLMFRKTLIEFIDKYSIGIIAYEKPGGRNYNGIRSHSNFEGIIVEVCEEKEIEYKSYSAKEIKKAATDNGNAGKPLMISSAKEKYNIKVIDDNHADAIHLYHYSKQQLGC